MKHSNGIYLIPVKINDIEADFILNSGFSETQISPVLLNELIVTGNITEQDIISGNEFYDTKGEITEDLKIKIKKIKAINGCPVRSRQVKANTPAIMNCR